MTCDRGQKGLNLGRRIWWPFIESDFRFFLSSGLEAKSFTASHEGVKDGKKTKGFLKNTNEIGKDNKFHNNYRFKYKKTIKS